jgi:hypothetical protein
MQLDSGAISTILVFAAAQTGALIFYAGVMLAMIRNHDRRLDKNEDRVDALSASVSKIAGSEGIQL